MDEIAVRKVQPQRGALSSQDGAGWPSGSQQRVISQTAGEAEGSRDSRDENGNSRMQVSKSSPFFFNNICCQNYLEPVLAYRRKR